MMVDAESRALDLELETLTLEQEDRVLTVRVVAPPYNFMTARMQLDFDALTRAVDLDPSVGAVVVTGGVPERFITHFDVGDILEAAERGKPISRDLIALLMRGIETIDGVRGGAHALERTPLGGLLNITRFNQIVLRIMRSPAVWIAAVDGPCGGGGLELAACFDLRFASDSETTGFLLPELLIGLTTTVGGQRLAQLIGPSRAMEMLLEGRTYTAHEALAMGLISRVVPAADTLAAAQRAAAIYARRNRATIAAQKKIFNEDYFRRPAESLRLEGATNASGAVAGPAPRALRAWVEMQQARGGDSAFLTDLDQWSAGTVVDLNAAP